MRILRLLVMVGAVMGGYLVLPSAPASATPFTSGPLATAAVGEPAAAYAHYRRYRHRHYAPRRAYRPYRYYRPRYYRPRYYRPRVVCRVHYTYRGPRRVCYRR